MILGRRQDHDALAIGQREDGQLLALEELLDHDLLARFSQRALEHGPGDGDGLDTRLTHHRALPGG